MLETKLIFLGTVIICLIAILNSKKIECKISVFKNQDIKTLSTCTCFKSIEREGFNETYCMIEVSEEKLNK